MEISTILLVLVFVCLCIIPISALHRKNKNKRKELSIFIKDSVQKNNDDIAQLTCESNFAIALSQRNPSIYFVERKNPLNLELIIPIANIKSCTPLQEKREYLDGKNTVSTTSKMGLTITLKNKDIVSLIFFDEHRDIELNGEFILQKKWISLLDNIIVKN